MKNLPTDLQILDAIYNRYFESFVRYETNGYNNDRTFKAIVPIDISQIANDLSADPEIVFGRLYFYFGNKYKYTSDSGIVSIFIDTLENGFHSVNFPYMASILADLRYEEAKHENMLNIARGALAISMLSAAFAALALIL